MSHAEEQMLFALRLAGLPEPEREYRFATSIGREWRFDFCWPDRMLAVECEGGVWTQGRHTRGSGFTEDCVKYSRAALMGWTVLRVTPDMVEAGTALDLIEEALQG